MRWTYVIAFIGLSVIVACSADSSQKTLVNPWTRKSTGCQCRHDLTSSDCACCVDGACQCGVLGRHQCAKCGYASAISCAPDSVQPPTDNNGWTGAMQCPCPNKNTANCACCENDGCRCANDPYQCTQCGREDVCPMEQEVSSSNCPTVPTQTPIDKTRPYPDDVDEVDEATGDIDIDIEGYDTYGQGQTPGNTNPYLPGGGGDGYEIDQTTGMTGGQGQKPGGGDQGQTPGGGGDYGDYGQTPGGGNQGQIPGGGGHGQTPGGGNQGQTPGGGDQGQKPGGGGHGQTPGGGGHGQTPGGGDQGQTPGGGDKGQTPGGGGHGQTPGGGDQGLTPGGGDQGQKPGGGGHGQTPGGGDQGQIPGGGDQDQISGGGDQDQNPVTRPPFLCTTPSTPPPPVTHRFINQYGNQCFCLGTTPATTTTTTTTTTTSPAPTGPIWVDRWNSDCDTLANSARAIDVNGIQQIHPSTQDPFDVNCQDGWTVIQSRTGPEENFNRNWNEYKNGFGDVNAGNFWVGLENIYHLTNARRYRLRVQLKSFNRLAYWIEYENFWIDNEAEGYRLHIEGLSTGNAGDALRFRGLHNARFHNGMKFSTKDRDHDNSRIACAGKYRSGWWFNNCYTANLNGPYMLPGRKGGRYAYCGENGCVSWNPIHAQLSMKRAMMMIKPVGSDYDYGEDVSVEVEPSRRPGKGHGPGRGRGSHGRSQEVTDYPDDSRGPLGSRGRGRGRGSRGHGRGRDRGRGRGRDDSYGSYDVEDERPPGRRRH